MSNIRANSFPDLFHPANLNGNMLEGVTSNVKLLLKLIQDQQDASREGNLDTRQSQRQATMLTILDEIRYRIETSRTAAATTTPPTSPRKPELRRCNTELRRSPASPKKLPAPSPHPLDPLEEIQNLRRELASSVAARKNLEKMFSSLGREKEMIARELSKKVQELACMGELVDDIREQNEMLSEKVRVCANEHKGKKGGGGVIGVGMIGGSEIVLQERNKALSEHLVKSLDGYRSIRRRLKEEREEKEKVNVRLSEMADEAIVAEKRAREIREKVRAGGLDHLDRGVLEEELCLLEKEFARFHRRLSGKAVGGGSTVNPSESPR